MSTIPLQPAYADVPWKLPSRGKVGMSCLIIAESAMFAIFVVAYVYYMGRDISGPKPHDVLKTPILGTICLLSSSIFIWFAERAIERDRISTFKLCWGVTMLLGLIFLADTAMEWHKLITVDHLTVSTNLFGTTFYCLVGLHAMHVIVGILMLGVMWVAALLNRLSPAHTERVQVLSLYWHFVDAIWVVVLTVVYVVGTR